MPSRVRPLAAAAIALLMAGGAHAQFAETFVEPYFKDCDDRTIRPSPFSTQAANDQGLDDDPRVEGALDGGLDEDDDGDAIFETIQAALDETSAGGIVNIIAGGVYREELDIDDSVTIRGNLNGRVVLDGTCGGLNTAVDFTGSDKVVRLENLTIRGFDVYGVNANDSDLTLVNCRIENCPTGIDLNGDHVFTMIGSHVDGCSIGLQGGGDCHVVDSVFEHCGYGIVVATVSADASLGVSGTKILRSTNDGISMIAQTAGVFTLTVHGSQVASNGGRGIRLSGSIDSSLRVTGSLVEGNGSDGIYMENIDGCESGTPDAFAIVADSRVEANAGDGLELVGSGSACGGQTSPSFVKAAILGNSLAMNGAYGINGDSRCSFVCGVGENQLSYNGSGAENSTGGPYCTLSTTNNNQGS